MRFKCYGKYEVTMRHYQGNTQSIFSLKSLRQVLLLKFNELNNSVLNVILVLRKDLSRWVIQLRTIKTKSVEFYKDITINSHTLLIKLFDDNTHINGHNISISSTQTQIY